MAPGAPLVHEQFGSNLVFEIERGDRRKTEAAMASAAKVVELGLNNNRLSANPIEPRSYLCDYDAARDRYTLYATTQQPHYLRRWLSVYTLHIPEHKIRVISPDVGGAFGVKGNFAVEVSTVVWAAQLLRRPVKWTATRTETFLSDAQARDHDTTARMGFDRDGRIVAMQIDTLAALGGYLSNFAPSIPGNSYPQTVTGLYKTPNLHLRVRGVYTNTVPVDAYRGSGRPEATWTNERLIELGARELGIDVVEMRRRNLISRGRISLFRAREGGCTIPAIRRRCSSGCLTIADYAALRREQASAARERRSDRDRACRLRRQGRHRAERQSRQARRPARRLGERHRARAQRRQGDRARGKSFARAGARDHVLPDRGRSPGAADRGHAPGRGRYRSNPVRQRHLGRALGLGGGDGGLPRLPARSLDKARRFAAQLLECAEGDVDYGARHVQGARHRPVDCASPRSPTSPITARCCRRAARPGLEVTEFYDPPDTNDPQAMHLAVVVVDPETGLVRLRALYAADDCGVVINPMIVEGQVHGGLAQGIGQALTEHIVYDRASGQLLTASFLDYGMPRAADLPAFHTTFIATPAPSNPLGVKGASESGAIGAPAAIGNAVIDALWHLGVRDITLPITSETVWRALRDARPQSRPRSREKGRRPMNDKPSDIASAYRRRARRLRREARGFASRQLADGRDRRASIATSGSCTSRSTARNPRSACVPAPIWARWDRRR